MLVVGDFHIPDRANAIPEQFKELLKPGRMQHVLCTGNLTAPAQMEAVMELAPNVHTVRGDCDEDETLPEETVVVIGSFRIGLCHGHQVSPAGSTQALAHLQRRMDVDVLVTGHTHQHSIVEYEVCGTSPGLATPQRPTSPAILLHRTNCL